MTYGGVACDEMRAQVLPLHRGWASAIERAIELQEEQNANVERLLAQMGSSRADPLEVAQATDTIARFASWLGSLKGRPLDPATFFAGAKPSTIAKRRLSKLVGALEHMIAQLTPIAAGPIPGAATWLEELRAAHAIAVAQRDAQRAGRTAQANLTPELEKARADWLATYVANKRLVEGVLRHHGKEHLMPLVFDDLAEVQRTKPRRPDAPVED
ncbi:hypothetical protein DB32_006429 [Sandaracinus amylolyticus]|uniref:Uncharacterized protein n=1 Tax=Sandaracinus amylolyticus TaxID=927083 RepID=A0A0F6W7C8_9BACT|nr:hypothetical protein DB32_006429 [Sandaracinus amylolyticus]